MNSIAATARTISAIRKADSLVLDNTGGKWRKGTLSSSGGTTIRWAKVTTVTDANNYKVSVWASRSSYVNGDSAMETGKQCRVPDITDSLAINDLFPVESASITGEDYICIQQIGLL
jgi:hypothetical protein